MPCGGRSGKAPLRHADVVAVLAWGFLDQHTDALEGFNPNYTDADADAALERMISAALPPAEASTVARQAVCDLPARALHDAATGNEMLVVGARGLGGFRGLLLGSVSQHCVHHATVPTVVVRNPRHDPGTAGIVVGIDGSEDAQRALAWAADEARRRATRLTVVHGYQVPLVGAYPYATMTTDPTLMPRAARHLLDRALEHVDTSWPGRHARHQPRRRRPRHHRSRTRRRPRRRRLPRARRRAAAPPGIGRHPNRAARARTRRRHSRVRPRGPPPRRIY